MAELFHNRFIPNLREELCMTSQNKDKMEKEFDLFFGNLCKKKFIMFLIGSSGCGKNTFVKYYCEQIQGKKINYMNILKQTSINSSHIEKQENKSFNDSQQQYRYNQQQKNQNDNNQDPIKFLQYIVERASYPQLYQNEVIVVKDFPILTSNYQKQQFKNIMQKYKDQIIKNNITYNKIIFVINNTVNTESQIKKSFDQPFIDSHIVIKNFISPTDNVLKKRLKEILNKLESTRKLPSNKKENIAQEISITSQGDIQMAINSLYMAQIVTSQPNNSNQQYKEGKKKETEFGLYHTIGKFMYNKRIMKGQNNNQSQAYPRKVMINNSQNLDFYFNPLELITQTPCDKDVLRGFLQENYLDFYSDLEDIAEQAQQIVQCDIFEKNNFKNERDDRMKFENKVFNTYLCGVGTMLNNYGKEGDSKFQFKSLNRSCDIELKKIRSEFVSNYKAFQQDQPNFAKISKRVFILDYYQIVKDHYPQQLRKHKINLNILQLQNGLYGSNNNYNSSGYQPSRKWGRLQGQEQIKSEDYKGEEKMENENLEEEMDDQDDDQNINFQKNNGKDNQNSQNSNNSQSKSKFQIQNSQIQNLSKQKQLQKLQEEELEDDIEECE